MRATTSILLAGWLAWAGAAHALNVEVRVEGVTGELRENVNLMLSLVRYRELPELSDAMIRRLHARAPGEIRQALQPYGHYAPAIESRLETVAGGWIAHYRIDPGSPVRIGEIEVSIDGDGADEMRFAGILAAPGLARGEPLRHSHYERLKQRLRMAAAELGYLDARFVLSELRVSVEEMTADVILHYETGPQYRFGPITLEQDILDEGFVQRYVQISQGEPFNQLSLLTLQYSLSDSEYFSAVEIESRRGDAVGLEVPVIVRMQPRAKHRYTAGVGYGTDTGPRVVAGWENRRINQRGHRMATDARVSRIKRSLGTRYLIPLDNPVYERLSIGTQYVREELGDTDTERVDFVVARTTMIGRWQHTLSPRVMHERDRLDGVTTSTTQLIPESDWLLTRRGSGTRPRSGHRLGLNLQASDPSLGAPAGYLRVRARGRLILPVGENDRVLLRGELGTIFTGDIEQMTVSQRFFAGGDMSVRGYGFNSLGPRDAEGRVIGGRHLAVASLEYERWLGGNWGMAAFVDSGNAFNERSVDLFTGAGLGMRWQSPVGVVAVDLAHPFDDPAGRNLRLHLSIGVDL